MGLICQVVFSFFLFQIENPFQAKRLGNPKNQVSQQDTHLNKEKMQAFDLLSYEFNVNLISY